MNRFLDKIKMMNTDQIELQLRRIVMCFGNPGLKRALRRLLTFEQMTRVTNTNTRAVIAPTLAANILRIIPRPLANPEKIS